MYELYVKAVSFSAGCASTAMMLTPLLVCKDIVKQKSSDHVGISTFVGALFRSSIFCRQGFILNLPTIKFVHGMGLIANTLYLSLYWYYSSKKKDIMSTIFKATILNLVILTYSFIESTDLVESRFSILVSIIHLSLVGWPLLSLRETIQMKTWSGHPKPILINTTLVCTLWLLYSINIKNTYIFTQCILALLLSVTQLGLSVKYPTQKIQSKKTEKHE